MQVAEALWRAAAVGDQTSSERGCLPRRAATPSFGEQWSMVGSRLPRRARAIGEQSTISPASDQLGEQPADAISGSFPGRLERAMKPSIGVEPGKQQA
ncbi:hypothetical protein Dimus_037137 [Dionaea muscipula]